MYYWDNKYPHASINFDYARRKYFEVYIEIVSSFRRSSKDNTFQPDNTQSSVKSQLK